MGEAALQIGTLGPGIYSGIPAEVYHGLPYVSNSYLSRLDKCPAAARVPTEETDALVFGRAAHSYILEGPEVFCQEFVVAPKIDKRTKAGKEQWAEFQEANTGRGLITADDMATIEDMRAAVHAHPFAKKLLGMGVSEQTVIWEDLQTGIMCKCRPDRIPSGGKGVLVDLKTTQEAGEISFARSMVKYGYARQAAMYLDGVARATGETYDAFAFIAVEKSEPYRVETYLIDPEFIQWGRLEYQRLLRLEQMCRAEGEYPNYQHPELVTIYKPNYL
jgi:hypothetical protein